MTPQTLTEYIKVYEGHLSDELCKSAVTHLDAANWKIHEFYSYSDESTINDNELSVSYDNIPEAKEINERIWFAIERYILKDFDGFKSWWNGWNGYTSVRFNRYDPTTQMKLHCDHIHSMFDGNVKGVPTLTVLGALNDDYEGGEFMMFGDYRVHLPAGAVVVFPSNFMFPHEVKPVKSGVRYSYVSWIW